MDARQQIKNAAMSDDYRILRHALEEADKDGISIEMIEQVMIRGMVTKTEKVKTGKRYTLYSRCRNLFISVEISLSGEVVVVTTGRER